VLSFILKGEFEMADTNDGSGEQKARRHRSPAYPTISLREAVDRLRKFYEADGKVGAPPEVAVKHMGYSTAHGAAMSALAALKKFGLVADCGGRIVPTQRALEILNLAETDPRRSKALKDACLNPSIYREVATQNPKGLPSDDALESEFVTYRNFNPNAVKDFVKDFRESLEFAGISDLEVLELTTEVEVPPEPSAPTSHMPPPQQPRPGDALRSIKPTQDVHVFTWPLSKDIVAELRLTGSDVKPGHFEMLMKYLELAKMGWEADN
jgi:hypothetical protein